MATARREQADSLIALLAEEPYRFDPRQAVRILEANRRLHKTGKVRFRSSLSLAFPISDLESVMIPPAPRAPVVTVSFLGLGGAMGPLPTPYTEYLNAGVRRGETAGRDFLDLFNHRLITSAMDLSALFRPALERGLPQQSNHAKRLYALLGLGTPGLVEKNPEFAASLLPLAGLLHQEPLSAHAIERAVSSHFRVEARVIPFRGGWMRLPADQCSVLGVRGRNQRLGQSAMLGRRVWDQSANITLVIGPLSLDAAERFLPPEVPAWPLAMAPVRRKKSAPTHAKAVAVVADKAVTTQPVTPHRQMADLLEFLVAGTVGVQIRLLVNRPTLRPSRIGRAHAFRLGWTSHLKSRADDDVAGVAAIVLRPDVAIPSGRTG